MNGKNCLTPPKISVGLNEIIYLEHKDIFDSPQPV